MEPAWERQGSWPRPGIGCQGFDPLLQVSRVSDKMQSGLATQQSSYQEGCVPGNMVRGPETISLAQAPDAACANPETVALGTISAVKA